jgi:hypothetical protein
MRVQSRIEAARAGRGRAGYEAVKVCEAMYFLDFPATRSPNILPEGMIAKTMVTTTEIKNWTMPTIRGIIDLLLVGKSSTIAM